MSRRADGPGPARPTEAVPPPAVQDSTWERLEDQIGWNDGKKALAGVRCRAPS
jgi:hypothetical protein